VFQKLFKRRSAAKESPMSVATQTTPPATTPAAPDVNAQIAALTGAVAQVVETQKTVLAHLAKPPAEPAKPATAPAAGEKPLTQSDVQKAIADALTARQQTDQQTAARAAFVGKKLSDLPAVYQNQLGNDPAKWDAEEQQIRSAFQNDFKAAGGKVADVGGSPAGGAPPAATVDLTNLTPVEKIALGLKSLQTPDRSATPTPVQAPAK
jgi:hypothetical protein